MFWLANFKEIATAFFTKKRLRNDALGSVLSKKGFPRSFALTRNDTAGLILVGEFKGDYNSLKKITMTLGASMTHLARAGLPHFVSNDTLNFLKKQDCRKCFTFS